MHWWSKPKLYSAVTEKERVQVRVVGIPEYYAENYRKRKCMWKKEKLEQLLVENLRECDTEHFFCSEEASSFLGQSKVSVPLFLMEEMLLRYGIKERLILVGNPNPLFDNIFTNYMEKVNFLQLLCENRKDYEQEAEWLYQTYGIVTVIREINWEADRKEGRKNAIGQAEKSRETFGQKYAEGQGQFRSGIKGTMKQPETLVVDMEPCLENSRPVIDLRGLPEGTVYMDMCSEREKCYRITKKYKNLHYLSPESLLNKWCHLDTTAQNGYNTRVKLEVL